jgi:hypothetical protein
MDLEKEMNSRFTNRLHGTGSTKPCGVTVYRFGVTVDFKPIIYQISIPRLITNNTMKIITCGTATGWPS